MFIFIVHFIIDSSRPYIEAAFIPKEDFVVFKTRKDILLWFKGEANKEVTDFLNAYYYRWILINVFDQGMHITSIAVCTWLFYSI